jgi:hypothetical protein
MPLVMGMTVSTASRAETQADVLSASLATRSLYRGGPLGAHIVEASYMSEAAEQRTRVDTAVMGRAAAPAGEGVPPSGAWGDYASSRGSGRASPVLATEAPGGRNAQ